jgi:hypothetical protein
MKFGAPQIIWAVLMFVMLLHSAYEHGKEKEGKNSFWASFIGVIVYTGLAWWGGFFG